MKIFAWIEIFEYITVISVKKGIHSFKLQGRITFISMYHECVYSSRIKRKIYVIMQSAFRSFINTVNKERNPKTESKIQVFNEYPVFRYSFPRACSSVRCKYLSNSSDMESQKMTWDRKYSPIVKIMTYKNWRRIYPDTKFRIWWIRRHLIDCVLYRKSFTRI